MKPSILIVTCILPIVVSCGRRDTSTNTNTDCRSRENMVIKCRVVNQPNYGHQYAQEMCDREYSANKCY